MSKIELFHDDIVQDYLDNGLSMRELEKKYGINRKLISAYFNAHNIPRRGHRKHIDPHIQEKLNDKDWLISAYNKTRSSQKIADALGVTRQCVLKYMKIHGIVPRGNTFYFSGESHDIMVDKPEYQLNGSKYTSTLKSHKPRDSRLRDRSNLLAMYKDTMNIKTLAGKLGVSYATVQNALHYHNIPIARHGNTSNAETLLKNKLSDLNPIQSHKIDGIEFDLFFPDYNVAVEVHGLRFHSEISGGKYRPYHQNKYDICRQSGIHLYQFWEFEVLNKTDLVCSMIRSKCGVSRKLDARKCTVVHNIDVTQFLEQNHIQGSVNYTHSVALVYNENIVSVMTFVKSRNAQYDYELNRFCSIMGYNVRGAFSRLFSHAPTGIIVSYSDCRYSNGNVYGANGFELIRTNDPIYYYTRDYKTLENRMKYQKSKIKSKFPDVYDECKTEWELMRELGFDRVWSCKTHTWVKTKR